MSIDPSIFAFLLFLAFFKEDKSSPTPLFPFAFLRIFLNRNTPALPLHPLPLLSLSLSIVPLFFLNLNENKSGFPLFISLILPAPPSCIS